MHDIAKTIAEAHVEWFLEMIKPLLIEHMIHGFKHGMEYKLLMEEDKNDGQHQELDSD